MNLLEPLRAKVERLRAEALEQLRDLPSDFQGTMGTDAAGDALETMENVGAIAADLHLEVFRCEMQFDGFDTWQPHERERFVGIVRPFANKMEEVAKAVADVLRAERAEIEELRHAAR